MKIKKNDKVVVISGKDKGKLGVVKEVLPNKDMVIVEEVNMKTHHVKPTQQNPEGGIIKKEAPIHVSNVMLNVGSKKEIQVSKIGFRNEVNKNGKKTKKRYSKRNNEVL